MGCVSGAVIPSGLGGDRRAGLEPGLYDLVSCFHVRRYGDGPNGLGVLCATSGTALLSVFALGGPISVLEGAYGRFRTLAQSGPGKGAPAYPRFVRGLRGPWRDFLKQRDPLTLSAIYRAVDAKRSPSIAHDAKAPRFA